MLEQLDQAAPNALALLVFGEVAAVLDWKALDEPTRHRWREATDPLSGDGAALAAHVLEGLVSSGSDEARALLLNRAREGEVSALTQLAALDSPPTRDVAEASLDRLVAALQRKITEAEGGSHGFGGYDLPVLVGWLNMTHPEIARWDVMLDLLEHPKVSSEDKHGALRYLAASSESLPSSVAERLSGGLEKIQRAFFWGGPTREQLRRAALVLGSKLGAVSGEELEKRVVEMAASRDRGSRRAAVQTMRDASPAFSDEAILIGFLGDQDDDVRIAAAGAAARRVLSSESASLRQAFLAVLGDAGAALPLAALRWLRPTGALPPWLVPGVRSLDSHLSAEVRAAASRLLDSP